MISEIILMKQHEFIIFNTIKMESIQTFIKTKNQINQYILFITLNQNHTRWFDGVYLLR